MLGVDLKQMISEGRVGLPISKALQVNNSLVSLRVGPIFLHSVLFHSNNAKIKSDFLEEGLAVIFASLLHNKSLKSLKLKQTKFLFPSIFLVLVSCIHLAKQGK